MKRSAPHGGTLRTFCVIPFGVRDHQLFQAVHEDRIIVNHQGRLQDAHFSGVLSPSHNLSVNILGPLLEAVQHRRNAALLLCMPTSGESSEAAMQLYSNFLPLLFRAAPQCSIAHVAIVDIRKDGRHMTDMLRNCRPPTLNDLETEEVLRANSTSHWGDVMEKLSQRCFSPTAAAESSLFVRIELENYCEVILGDLGHSQEALHLATLALRSEGHSGSRTSPPHVPFTYLLSGVIPPRGVVHLVCIPDPVHSVSFSMRLIHFVSTFDRGAAVLDLRDESASDSNNNKTSSIASPTRRQDVPPATSVSKRRFSPSGEDESGDQWRNEFLVDVENGSLGFQQQPRPSSPRRRVPSSAANASGHVSSSPILRDASAVASPSPSTTKMTSQRRSEKVFMAEQVQIDKAEEFKRKIRSMQEEVSVTKAALDNSTRALSEAQAKLQEKDSFIAKTTSDSENMSELINKLLKRVGDLESVQGKGNASTQDMKAKSEELALKNATLSSQLNDCISELRMLKRREANRVRTNTLQHIESPVSRRPTTPQRGNSSKKHKTKYADDNTDDTALGTLNPAAAVVVKQLRTKADKLEQENRELRLKLEQEEAYRRALTSVTAHHSISGGRAAGAAIEERGGSAEELFSPSRDASSTPSGSRKISEYLERECNTLKQQVAFFTTEVARVQQEKDNLQKIVTTHPRTVELSDGVNAVVNAVAGGCDALLTQLSLLELGEQQNSAARNEARALVDQHTTAVQGLKSAVKDIASRRSTGSSAIPTTASAGDCELMSHFLTFEIERLSHLRAFLPSFAQLCAGVDRLKMTGRGSRYF